MNLLRYLIVTCAVSSVRSYKVFANQGFDPPLDYERPKWRKSPNKLSKNIKSFNAHQENNKIVTYNKEDAEFNNENIKTLPEQSVVQVPLVSSQNPVVTSLLSRVRRDDAADRRTRKNMKKCGKAKCPRRTNRKKKRKRGKKRKRTKKPKNKGKKRKSRKIKIIEMQGHTYKNVTTLFSNQTISSGEPKAMNEDCVRSYECQPGFCCARHNFRRVCRPVAKEGEVCTRQEPKHKKRSPQKYELCPCEENLVCKSTNSGVPGSRLSKCMAPVT